MFFLLGGLVMAQLRVVGRVNSYVSIKDIETLSNQINTLEIMNANHQTTIQNLREKIDAYLETEPASGDLETVLRREVAQFKILSGTEKVYGPGVVVIVSDAEKPIVLGDDPNNYIVHDLDLLEVVHDLKNAGAEAIAINGQRIIPHQTSIICNGPTISIDNVVYSQPYIIEAIGDRKFLEAAATSPDSYTNFLKQWGLFTEVNTSVYLELEAYKSRINYEYMIKKED
ncbi:MAG: hypothetical protein AVO33_02690 [delta proteobacterium ML8_F1]|nr:MAG: hypothetical protein AVO33_02690 [delta proteobacterium ML8_F1]